MTEKMYSLKEIGEIVGLTRRTLLTYVAQGKLKAVKVGNAWRVSKENMTLFLQGN